MELNPDEYQKFKFNKRLKIHIYATENSYRIKFCLSIRSKAVEFNLDEYQKSMCTKNKMYKKSYKKKNRINHTMYQHLLESKQQ